MTNFIHILHEYGDFSLLYMFYNNVMHADDGVCSIPLLLDLGIVFDTTDHIILSSGWLYLEQPFIGLTPIYL